MVECRYPSTLKNFTLEMDQCRKEQVADDFATWIESMFKEQGTDHCFRVGYRFSSKLKKVRKLEKDQCFEEE